MRTFSAIAGFLFFTLLPLQQSFAGQPISLGEAVEKGLVNVEVITGRGATTGDAVSVRVRRAAGVSTTVEVKVKPGTVFVGHKDVQPMVAGGVKYEQVSRGHRHLPNKVMVLADARSHTYVVETYCTDYSKMTPGTRSTFVEVKAGDEFTTKVIVEAERLGLGPKVVQAAIWIENNNVDVEVLKSKFKTTDEEVKAAQNLLVAVKAGDSGTTVSVEAEEAIELLVALIKASRIGQKAVVTRNGTEVKANVLPRSRTIATLDADAEVRILANLPRQMNVVFFNERGRRQTGWVQKDELILKSGVARVAPQLRDAANEFSFALETFTRTDE